MLLKSSRIEQSVFDDFVESTESIFKQTNANTLFSTAGE